MTTPGTPGVATPAPPTTPIVAVPLNWGILGAGNIAKDFARGLAGSKTGKLIAVASRDRAKAEAFADEFAAPGRFDRYDALLQDPHVQAVYIATPHPMHARWAVEAARAKKHVLCEKPIGLNYGEAMAVVEAARLNDVFLMEAYMYRCHPQTRKLVELVRERAVGDVKLIQAAFSFRAGFNPEARLWNNALGGGGILDVGGYPVSLARLLAGAANGQAFLDPVEIKGCGHLNPRTHVDEYAVASLKFPGGIVAGVAAGVAVNQENVVRVYGSEGHILLRDPWVPAREGGSVTILVHRDGEKEPHRIVVKTESGLYSIEADTVAEHLARRQAPSPAMGWDDTLGNMRALDQWRQSIGLTYQAEEPHNVPTVHRRPLAPSPGHNMKYGSVAGVAKPISRLVMGVDNLTSAPTVAVMWDDFFERGGNCWDTAHIYGGGACERALGAWVKSRGLREEVVILSKGGHTPECYPRAVTRQHHESLSRLDTPYVDLYMLHRDNPEVPAGEFIDALNEHVNAGTIKTLGASNWTIERVAEANEWAKRNGKAGFAALSNNFSLARMAAPVWAGCVAASDPASRAWLAHTRLPLMPWSSQARGFFLPGRAAPQKTDDAELVRAWYSPDNFQRLERANQLADQKGVLAINIALAYVLSQPFPTFPLIGPRTLQETHTSLTALDVELTERELKWLNLEVDSAR